MGDDVGLGIVIFRAALKTRVPNADESYFDPRQMKLILVIWCPRQILIVWPIQLSF